MAHFAQIDRYGTVVNVLSFADEDVTNTSGEVDDVLGNELLHSVFPANPDYDYKRTSYNTIKNEHRTHESDGSISYNLKPAFRKNYAAIGGKYDYVRDAFVGPRPSGSHCSLDTETMTWEAFDQGAQSTANNGVPLGYTDRTDYSVNATRNPQGWVWDNSNKTYVQTEATVEIPANYVYNSALKIWERA